MTPDADKELRQAIADELAHWPIGSGYGRSSVDYDEALDMADALLSDAGPVGRLVAELVRERARKNDARVHGYGFTNTLEHQITLLRDALDKLR